MTIDLIKNHIIKLYHESDKKNLVYHNLQHVIDVYHTAVILGHHFHLSPAEFRQLEAAALLHDIGYLNQEENHEEVGAEKAIQILLSFGWDIESAQKVKDLILCTKMGSDPQSVAGKIICDADFDYLGRTDYLKLSEQLREEWKTQGNLFSDQDWKVFQLRFLSQHKFHLNFVACKRKQMLEQNINYLKERINQK